MVLVGALAVRHARLAGRHRGPAHVLPRQPEHDRARHHPPLGEPDDLLRARADGRRAVQRRRHPLDRARADRRPHVEEPRHRHEPVGADRLVRRRRDALYHLTFDDFCDWYLETIKARLYAGDSDALATAGAALERLLKLLHPAMPHVTEEIWSYLPRRESRLIVAPWPGAGDEADAHVLDRVQEYAQVFRRSGVPPKLAGDELRIFEAVVKPDRAAPRNGDAEAARERLREEITRA